MVLVGLAPSQAGLARLPVTFALSIVVQLLVVAVGRRLGPPWLAWLPSGTSRGRRASSRRPPCCSSQQRPPPKPADHAALGALLLGVALGGGDAEHREAHDVVARFALGLFAPLYFVSLGLTTDFVQSFDAALVAVVVAAAISSKLAGVLLGAKLAGMRLDREKHWAISFGLNARGATASSWRPSATTPA